MSTSIQSGLAEHHRVQAAHLFWQAFKGKLGAVMGPEPKALSFVTQVLDPGHAISATDPGGNLLGIAGFKTAQGGFIGGGLGELAQVYGWFGALWRAPILSLLERELAADTLLMDGIFVDPKARGQGIGTQLLGAIKAEASARGLAHVRLDVIDTNPRAQALYEREGFVAGPVQRLGPLRHLFGFNAATTMTWTAIPPLKTGKALSGNGSRRAVTA